MFEKLEIFQMAQAMASHASLRQNAINQNIANADTPGFRARDVEPFAARYQAETATPLKSTRATHLNLDRSLRAELRERADPDEMSPDGNTVSLEDEMVRAVEVKRQHDLALGIYKSALNVMRTSLGRS
ncbi:FlgB family protein [Pseudothioclava arenosa]|uniref:Flagellar basal body rod protein FlgB n=1 Tax=Pseudothioclava arenosa TaxID=1795308 RepID=A0A2A4CQZ6_9RHOB|nr:FlgB family protein [Pseudothioclava arenosa]PCD76559.1 flagellar basal body rod protein FlgB [Pseudothioclava arenosa]